MKCAVHPEADATGFCRNCGKALCPTCTREVHGALYCEQCLTGVATRPQAAAVAVPPPTDSRPAIAAVLGFIPGLGAVYNGEYIKALIHVFIFASLIAAQNSDVPGGYHAFLGIALGCFYFYMPIDAYRVAKAKQEGKLEPSSFLEGEGRKPVGAIILIGLGIFLLLANAGLFRWDWLARGWPVLLIGLGVWMLADRWKRKQ
jgi:Domain of unknown function (DUF5668)